VPFVRSAAPVAARVAGGQTHAAGSLLVPVVAAVAGLAALLIAAGFCVWRRRRSSAAAAAEFGSKVYHIKERFVEVGGGGGTAATAGTLVDGPSFGPTGLPEAVYAGQRTDFNQMNPLTAAAATAAPSVVSPAPAGRTPLPADTEFGEMAEVTI
jgi:hypothetical protein